MWAGFGVLGPTAACYALRLGAGTALSAAALSSLLLAAAAWGVRLDADEPRPARAALAAAAAAVLAAAVLLPLLGMRLTGLLGLALAAAGAWALRRAPPAMPARPPVPPPPAWLLALAGAAAVSWARALSLLWGHSLYALCGLMAAAGVAFALACWSRDRAASALETAGLPRGAWALASGLAGVLGLGWLWFIGINSSSSVHLFSPLLGPWDLCFIAGQSALACGLWLMLMFLSWDGAAAAARPAPSRAAKSASALLAAAGPLAAWLALPRLDAAQTAAAAHLATAACCIAWTGPRTWLRGPVLSRVTIACLIAGAALGMHSRRLFSDIWLTRLNSAWAGGRFLARAEDGREYLAVYRFSSGLPVLLRDGASWSNAAAEARREAHLPLLMQGSQPRPLLLSGKINLAARRSSSARKGAAPPMPEPVSDMTVPMTSPPPAQRRVLLAGARHPATLTSAMTHQARLVVLDPHPGVDLILAAQSAGDWPPAPPLSTDAPPTAVRGDLRHYLRSGGPAFDVIILELPFPAPTPEWARLSTKEAFQELRGRLTPDGLLAARLPSPYPPMALARILRTAREVFAHVGGYDLPGGYLLACSERPLVADPATLLARRNYLVQADDLSLENELPGLRWDDYSELPAVVAALRPETDDRPSGFFPLPNILRGITLVVPAAPAAP